jgi:hypothetical protein
LLARRIDETPQFIASAVSSFAVELIGAGGRRLISIVREGEYSVMPTQ